MENNNILCLYGRSKRQKISNNEELDNAHKSDETMSIKKENVRENDDDTKNFKSDIEDGTEDVRLRGEHSKENVTSNYVSLIPTTSLQGLIINPQHNDDEIKQDIEESIGWNCLLEKVGESEEKIIKRITSEISVMKKSWEKSSCKCKYEIKKDFDKFTMEINRLKKENAQYNREKEILMKKNNELEEKLQKEQVFRLHLSGMLIQDVWNSSEENAEAATKKCETRHDEEPRERVKNKRSHSSQSSGIDNVKKSTSTRRTIQEYRTKKNDESKNNSIQTLKLSIEDKMPDKIPLEYLADEIEERKRRRCNIIMKGIKLRNGHLLLDDVTQTILKRTGIRPLIIDFRIIESGFLLKMISLKNKIAIMKRKDKFKTSNITLEDDLTSREHQVQDWLIEVAREDAKMGKKTEVAFFKIKQGGVWKIWNENLGKLVND